MGVFLSFLGVLVVANRAFYSTNACSTENGGCCWVKNIWYINCYEHLPTAKLYLLFPLLFLLHRVFLFQSKTQLVWSMDHETSKCSSASTVSDMLVHTGLSIYTKSFTAELWVVVVFCWPCFNFNVHWRQIKASFITFIFSFAHAQPHIEPSIKHLLHNTQKAVRVAPHDKVHVFFFNFKYISCLLISVFLNLRMSLLNQIDDTQQRRWMRMKSVSCTPSICTAHTCSCITYTMHLCARDITL